MTLTHHRLKETMATLPLHRTPVGVIYLRLDPLERQKSVHRGEGRVAVNKALLDKCGMKSVRLNLTLQQLNEQLNAFKVITWKLV